MSGTPRVSVCITTRNQSRYIAQCIESVLAQQGDFELEVLVGDDASNDGTDAAIADLATRNPNRVFHLRSPTNIGAAANTRLLVERARGDFIARLDGDDYWLPTKLAKQLDALRSAPDCTAVYTNALTVDSNDRAVGLFNDAGDLRLNLGALLRNGNFLNNSSMLFRAAHRGAWLALSDLLLDYRVHLLLATHGDVLHIGEPLVVYRISAPGSMVTEANARVRELYWRSIMDVPRHRISDADLARGQADFLRRVAFRALRTRDFGLLRQWIPRVLAESPVGTARMAALTCAAIARAAAREAAGWCSVQTARSSPVLYRR
jgi:glycosyltransferase involved in cell wall biosynthesis